MKKQNSDKPITFKQLVDAINDLHPEEKYKLRQILYVEESTLVNDSQSVYVKSDPKDYDFEEKWSKGLNSKNL